MRRKSERSRESFCFWVGSVEYVRNIQRERETSHCLFLLFYFFCFIHCGCLWVSVASSEVGLEYERGQACGGLLSDLATRVTCVLHTCIFGMRRDKGAQR